VLTSSVSLFGEATRTRLAELSQYFMAHGLADPGTAGHEAMVAIGRAVRIQASVMAYGDTFLLLGAGLALAVLATLGLRRSDASGAGGAAH